MGNFYLDIETTGVKPGSHSIVTVQYAALNRYTGARSGELTVLKEWECGGERPMLERLVKETAIASADEFAFVPVGYNLRFEHLFLSGKAEKYGLPGICIIFGPHIDLHQVAILMNRGEFRGSGMHEMTDKQSSGAPVPKWYADRRYDLIEQYVGREFDEFEKFAMDLYRELPALRARLRGAPG